MRARLACAGFARACGLEGAGLPAQARMWVRAALASCARAAPPGSRPIPTAQFSWASLPGTALFQHVHLATELRPCVNACVRGYCNMYIAA